MSWIERHPENYGSYNLSSLRIDQAYVNFSSSTPLNLWLYELSTNCLTCPYKLVAAISSSTAQSLTRTISTSFRMKYRFRTSGTEPYVAEVGDEFRFCDVEHGFGEFGIYNVEASEGAGSDSGTCHLHTILEPVNIYLPILIVVLFLLLLELLIWTLNKYGGVLWGKMPKIFTSNKSSGNAESSYSPDFPSQTTVVSNENTNNKRRIGSLDTFRGICIVMMIFVHDSGASYTFMQHASWDGLTAADIIFPWFLWIMGVCIPISLKSQLKKRVGPKKILSKILTRSLKLIGFGLMLNTVWNEPVNLSGDFRVFGVLQRFGICYFICSILAYFCMSNEERFSPDASNALLSYHRNSSVQEQLSIKGKLMGIFKDVVVLWRGWIVISCLTLTYILVVFLLPVPDCPTGYIGPGGLHNNRSVSSSCVGGAVGYVDRAIWGTKYIYKWPTSNEVYQEKAEDLIPFDPEGTLGILTACLQVWFGIQAGMTFVLFPHQLTSWNLNILLRWMSWGLSQGLIGGILCGWKQTGGVIPINKNLWSISFVLVTTCMASFGLSILYIVIDVLKWWTGSPLAESGMNSIFLYVVHLSVQKMFPWHWRYGSMETHFMKLVEFLWGISIWICLAIWMKRKRIFFKI